MPRKTKPYHHGDLYEALVAAGTKLLNQKGPQALTLRACARAAGVSHAAPQHHFGNVNGLLAEIAARGFERFVAQLDRYASGASTPGERLEAMCRGYIDFALANGAVYGLMFRQGSSGLKSPHLQTALIAAWKQLVSSVAQVIGDAPQDELNRKAAYVWSLTHGLATLLLDRRFPAGLDQDGLIEATFKGLAAALKMETIPA
jgi:AcrR family transcriptional regulator